MPVGETVTAGSDWWKSRAADAEVVAAARHTTGVEFGNKRQHILPARSGCIAKLRDGEPVDVFGKQLRRHERRCIDRVAMESDAVALHHVTAAHQLTQIIAIHVAE